MTKSVYSQEKRGFSLAEALITLLIVCLITIASIPVLTKKRRNLETGSRGKWICTKIDVRNAAGNITGSKYVYWDKNNPHGDKNDPTTWKTTGNNGQAQCEFAPPAGASKFSVTIIGGGGGGASGKPYTETIAEVSSGRKTTYTHTDPAGIFELIMIGGGGGGGQYQDSDGDNSGGGGGSGAYFVGSIPLMQGGIYELYAGKGGISKGANYHGGWSDSTSHNRAENGEDSYFKAIKPPTGYGVFDTTTNISVFGGQGGDSIGCSNWRCRGGSAGGGATINEDITHFGWTQTDKSNRVTLNGVQYKTFHNLLAGADGEAGASSSHYTIPQGGKGQFPDLTGTAWLLSGKGGNGGSSYLKKAGETGTGGLVQLSKMHIHKGEGGKAAIPNHMYMPEIPGRLVVTIGERAESDKNGSTTHAVVVRNGIQGMWLTASGGLAGTPKEELEEPTAGEHSQFTMTGGGAAAGACTDRERVSRNATVTRSVKKCKQVICSIDRIGTSDDDWLKRNLYIVEKNGFDLNTDESTKANTYAATANMNQLPAGYVLSKIGYPNQGGHKNGFIIDNIKYPVPKQLECGINPQSTCTPREPDKLPALPWYNKGDRPSSSWQTGINYLCNDLNIELYINKLLNVVMAGPTPTNKDTVGTKLNNKNAFPARNEGDDGTEFQEYSNSDEIINDYRCYRDNDIAYRKICAEEEIVQEEVSLPAGLNYTNAKCENLPQDGQSFGAGGGGGNAARQVGVFTKGGRGGYGAVIVQW